MKILVVEDEYYTRKAIVKMMKEWGGSDVMVEDAESGSDALDNMENMKADIVFTDICMPEMDGHELCAKIKEKYPSTLFAVISGYSDFEYARKAMKLDIKDYVLKPVKKDNLFKLLDDLKQQLEKSNEERKYFADIDEENNISKST